MTGLIGWWPLHRTVGDAVDLSGDENHGTVNGTTRGVAGRGGLQAHSFDGTDDYIAGAAIPDGNPGFTVAVWVRSDTTGNNQAIAWWEDGTTGIGNQIFYDAEGFNSGNTNCISGSVSDSNGNNSEFETESNVQTTEWQHIVATWTASGGWTVYTNATELTLGHHTTNAAAYISNGFEVGRNTSGSWYWDGTICDLRFYDRALTAAEVQRLYEWGAQDTARPPSDLDDADAVSYWTLNEDPANTSTATDEWGNNDGTITGATQADPAVRGTGLSFDGTDDRVELPDLGLGSGGSFTVLGWIRLDDTTGNRSLFGRYDGSDDLLDLYWDGDIPAYRFRVGHFGGNNILASADGVTTGWNHLTGVYDSSGPTASLYLNAKRIDSVTGAVDDFSTTDGPWIGARSDGTEYLNGGIDDVRVYSRALSPAEIHEVYRYGTFGKDLRQETIQA